MFPELIDAVDREAGKHISFLYTIELYHVIGCEAKGATG